MPVDTSDPTLHSEPPRDDGTALDPRPLNVPRWGLRGSLRWSWRQLTSMRIALLLLMLLAVAAVPGSVLPQRQQDPGGVLDYLADHPGVGRWLDRAGFFDVYASVWFSAIYLLLFVSLVGCIIPRIAAHGRAVRARPPRMPRRLERFPVHREVVVAGSPADVADVTAARLRGRMPFVPVFRVDVEAAPDGSLGVRAERGYLRETGNLVFHLSLVGLLIAVLIGQMLHYRGQVLVTEGRGFANAVVDYDTFERGTLFDPASLPPFSMALESFDAEFSTDAESFGQSRDFTARVLIHDKDSGSGRRDEIKVNHPLIVHGTKIYLQGNGYAPRITVHDAAGQIAFAGTVPFLPQDPVYTSRGVIKVPDVSAGQDQIGLTGYLLPTGEQTANGWRSVFPQPMNPVLILDVYRGDLGLDDGKPQNAYRLDTATMREVVDGTGQLARVVVAPGQTVTLPDGLGAITFEGLPRYVALDLRHDPSLPWVLASALGALGGLALSLFTPRRRVWIRIRSVAEEADGEPSPASRVQIAALARGSDPGLVAQVESVLGALDEIGEGKQR